MTKPPYTTDEQEAAIKVSALARFARLWPDQDPYEEKDGRQAWRRMEGEARTAYFDDLRFHDARAREAAEDAKRAKKSY